jgi:hypothetical protein
MICALFFFEVSENITHTHTHTHTRARTHAHTHTRMRAHTFMYIYICMWQNRAHTLMHVAESESLYLGLICLCEFTDMPSCKHFPSTVTHLCQQLKRFMRPLPVTSFRISAYFVVICHSRRAVSVVLFIHEAYPLR